MMFDCFVVHLFNNSVLNNNSIICFFGFFSGAEQFIAEAERSLHDAICIVRRAMKHTAVVGGGGAIEMELSKLLREHAQVL